MNRSLEFIPYMRYSFGVLGGCSNASLNGVSVRAASSYLMNDTLNHTVVAGGWGAFTVNITKDGNSAAGTVRSGGMTGAFVGLLAVIFAFIL